MPPRKTATAKQTEIAPLLTDTLTEKKFVAKVEGRGEMECRGVDALDAVGDLAPRFDLNDDWQFVDVSIEGKAYVLHLPPRGRRKAS